ncbi:receptor family ligand binding protein [Nitzschia inconspicua]|uniref:Poly [ADP-ribose] polymerase n=1 Tax=Nitzschia inconspicua TaxID=303405 RepID=A0A9K3PC05_9STRA|nr:receptor family ligand binding protein [Nitzschia inconspicua]
MLSFAALLLIGVPLTASQSSFQCGDGNFSFVPVENGRECPCSTNSFLEFVNLGCPIPASPEQDNETIFLGGILDLEDFDWPVDIFRVTVDLYNEGFFLDNNGSPINNRALTYSLGNSKCDETETIRAYWNLRRENGDVPPEGVVGTRCSGPSQALANLLGVEGIPQISASATSGRLSDNERYPEFSRVVGPQNEHGEALAMKALLRSFGWNEISILTTDTSYSRDWETNLRKVWSGLHQDDTGSWTGVVSYSDTFRLSPEGLGVDLDSIQQVFENFPTNSVRVIVLFAHSADALRIIETAAQLKFQQDTIWIGSDLNDLRTWTLSSPSPAWIGLTPYRNHNENAMAFKDRLDDFHLSQGLQPWPRLPLYSAETVDSIVLLAHAIDLARDQPGGGDVTATLRGIVYENGVSGRIEFTINGDRKDPLYSVISMGNDGEWNEVGVASTTSATANLQMNKICWGIFGCALTEAPADTYPEPRIRLPAWAIAVLVVVCLALSALAFKYWRSTQSKKRLKNELGRLQKSIVGMRAAKMTYIPNIILEDNNRRLSIESRASPRVSSLLLSASLQSSGTDDGQVQWCWEETKGFLDKHDQSQMFGDPSDGWIMYDDYYNNILETAYKTQNGKGTVSLAPLDYVVDLEAMTQTKRSTGFVRNVMRWQEPPKKENSIISGTDLESTDGSQSLEFPMELHGEPQMVLVEGDVVQVSKQRDDGWAFGTKLFHAEEEIVREFVKVASASGDAEKGIESDVCADTGWFPLDWATRPPTADDLGGLQKNVSDTGELEAPSHWDPVKNPLIVQRHNLDTKSPEYQQVESAFLSTLKSRKLKIHGIERIQNMGMWQSYVVKRQTICYREAELDRPQAIQRLERCWLWHGTNKEVYEKIIQQGFNRSFCGKNATLWGKGVYFARDAEYSSRDVYSIPDSKGTKYVMACRVMVGEYCVGKTNAITPDVRCSRTHSLYDSTVDRMTNPGIYVTYHDAQAYPEYIIRFKFLD